MSESEPGGTLRGAVDLSSLVQKNTNGSAESGAASTASGIGGGRVFEGTDTNFSDFLDLSSTVPVLVDLWADWCGPCKQLTPVLERVVESYAGRLAMVTVDVDANPQLAQAFQAQSIPTVAALVAGRPVSLFTGAIPEDQVRQVVEQLLELATQNGVTGTLDSGAGESASDTEEAEKAPEPLPPHHAEAYEAIERGDFAEAIEHYRTAIAQDPNDTMAVAGLAQVELLARLDGHDPGEIRTAADDHPGDVSAQLLAADQEVSAGEVEAAFDRLLGVFPASSGDDRDRVRARLVDYFEIVGSDDPRVVRTRARLASLLF